MRQEIERDRHLVHIRSPNGDDLGYISSSLIVRMQTSPQPYIQWMDRGEMKHGMLAQAVDANRILEAQRAAERERYA